MRREPELCKLLTLLLLYPCLHSHKAPLPYTGLSLGRNQALPALLLLLIKITFCI